MVHTWDIFCSVVDNFGDVGVCWRLARALAGERGQKVRLWVDDLASLQRLCHTIDADNAAQRVAGVEIRRWQSAGKAPWPAVEVADIVIEGFGVRLPPDYIEAMAAARGGRSGSSGIPVRRRLGGIAPWPAVAAARPAAHQVFFLSGFYRGDRRPDRRARSGAAQGRVPGGRRRARRFSATAGAGRPCAGLQQALGLPCSATTTRRCRPCLTRGPHRPRRWCAWSPKDARWISFRTCWAWV